MLNALLIFLFFSFTIFIHELGHFLAARRLGLKILTFSIGMGPPVFKKVVNGIAYQFGAFPIGGYVSLPQMDFISTPDKKNADDKETLPYIEPWKRIVVALAGPAGNILFAIPLAWIVYLAGCPAEMWNVGTTIGYVETNSVLYAKGLRPADQITAVSGHPVANWEELLFNCAMEKQIVLDVRREKTMFQISSPATSVEDGALFISEATPEVPAIVEGTLPASSAEKAGLLPGDVLSVVAGEPVHSIGQVIARVSEMAEKEIPVVVVRGGRNVEVRVTPKYNAEAKRALIGIRFAKTIVHPAPSAQIRHAAKSVFLILHKIFTPAYSARALSATGGAPAIIFGFWQELKLGIIAGLAFTLLINVNLALINLLPIPVLDGGHILFALAEWISGRNARSRYVSAIWQATAVLLIGLILTRMVFDFVNIRSFYSRDASETPPKIETPAAPAKH